MDFNTKAKTWDDSLRVKRAEKIALEINEYIKDKELNRGLEFGCGTGLISFNLKDKFKYIKLVDNSQGMVEELNRKITVNNIKNMEPWCGDILSLEENDNYDVIYTSMALHHVIKIEEVITKLYALLKPEGKLVIVDLTEDDGSFHSEEENFNGHNGFNPNELKNLLHHRGFKDVKYKIFYKDKKVLTTKEVEYELFSIVGEK